MPRPSFLFVWAVFLLVAALPLCLAAVLTNAQQLQRGLPPLAPSKLFNAASRTSAKRATTSFVPAGCAGWQTGTSFLIRADSTSGQTLGWIPAFQPYVGSYWIQEPGPRIYAECFAFYSPPGAAFDRLIYHGTDADRWLYLAAPYAGSGGNTADWTPTSATGGQPAYLPGSVPLIDNPSQGIEAAVWSVVPGTDGRLQVNYQAPDGQVYVPKFYHKPDDPAPGYGATIVGAYRNTEWPEVELFIEPIVAGS